MCRSSTFDIEYLQLQLQQCKHYCVYMTYLKIHTGHEIKKRRTLKYTEYQTGLTEQEQVIMI